MTPPQSPIVWLHLEGGARAPHTLTVGSHVVGRSPDVGIVIPSPWVSQRHAELSWDGHDLSIRDLGSRNGTEVNGSPVVGWVHLADGDSISFADARAVVQLPPAPSDAADAQSPDHGSHGSPVRAPGPRRLSTVPIFVSHASEDKAAARGVAAYLRRVGWTVWIDESGIAGGKDWRAELVRALEDTWVVVLLVSTNAMRSKWVIREVQAADRLGKPVLPAVVDPAPYPDALRMILGGVQRIDLTGRDDEGRMTGLTTLDDALIRTSRQPGQSPPGKTQIAVGKAITAVGLVGMLIGFALFAFLAFDQVNQDPFADGGIPRPFIGWGVFAVSLVVTGVGEGIRRAGLHKGI